LLNKSALFTVIKELEYALLQLIHQVNTLLNAVQYTLLGKLPITIIGPVVLHSKLRNISLCLPETYELIAGTKFDDIHAYYKLIKVTSVGNAHGIKVILKVLLKTESQRFTLLRITVLPYEYLTTPSRYTSSSMTILAYRTEMSYGQRYVVPSRQHFMTFARLMRVQVVLPDYN
jgi:hypothetical protein